MVNPNYGVRSTPNNASMVIFDISRKKCCKFNFSKFPDSTFFIYFCLFRYSKESFLSKKVKLVDFCVISEIIYFKNKIIMFVISAVQIYTFLIVYKILTFTLSGKKIWNNESNKKFSNYKICIYFAPRRFCNHFETI